MKHPFLRKIFAAGRLSRQGRLLEATSTIQRALVQATTAGAHLQQPSPASLRRRLPVEAVDEARETEPAIHDDEGEVSSPVRVDAPPRAGRFVASSFTGAAGTRAFKLFSPGGRDGERLPLVVMLHGCSQDPDDFAAGTRMNALAQAEGVFVLYPAQAPRSNAHKCWNWFSPGDQRRGAGEPALIAGMVRHVAQTHPVDRDRVYVAGLSAGGAMAAILAREYPEVFAAAGIHSGLAAGAAHDVGSAFSVMRSGPALSGAQPNGGAPAGSAPGRAAADAPVIVFHGDADSTVAASNGDAVIAAALAAATGAIAETDAPRSAGGTRPVRRTVWRAARADAPTLAEQWVVRGAPHAWSGGAPAGSYTDSSGPDASREMLRFFREHPRRRG